MHPQMVAAYIAKYATKVAEDFGLAPQRIHPLVDLTSLPVSDHVRRHLATAVKIGSAAAAAPAPAWTRLAHWLHMLGFRGHFPPSPADTPSPSAGSAPNGAVGADPIPPPGGPTSTTPTWTRRPSSSPGHGTSSASAGLPRETPPLPTPPLLALASTERPPAPLPNTTTSATESADSAPKSSASTPKISRPGLFWSPKCSTEVGTLARGCAGRRGEPRRASAYRPMVLSNPPDGPAAPSPKVGADEAGVTHETAPHLLSARNGRGDRPTLASRRHPPGSARRAAPGARTRRPGRPVGPACRAVRCASVMAPTT